ncbi:methyltransferase, FkbM family [Natronorubrum sediminis]|uniref:Methyltransferase, FkbM family n=1 Tax=Natronorubrum sediminis TaxID=640943 RepID=A0A1H6FR38_9EURY|nr:FkbM family methyltransferase [Natronorubrum sediminis]SEH13379.1 methyltransferase, FkbM family [Natronorubrum sediminis]
MRPLESADRVVSRARSLARSVGYRTYDRVAWANYEYELLARTNRTAAGTVRCYEPLTRHADDSMLEEVAARCGSTDVIYDIGANVGIYALALASGSPDRRVVAFEPSPSTCERLQANIRANALENRIDVRPCGLGAETRTRPFYVSTYPELSAFDRESATRWGASVTDVRSVSSYRLDDLVREDDALSPPDVLKIDVEGAAPDVLRGARATLECHEPTVFVETHDEGLAGDVPAETATALESVGYEIDERDGYWRCSPRYSS